MFKRSERFARYEQRVKSGTGGFSDGGAGMPLVARWLGKPALRQEASNPGDSCDGSPDFVELAGGGR